ncbi:MAG: cytochrome P450 [Acidimicrobiales bacterium]
MAFWSAAPDEREEVFRELRGERPVSWHRPAEGGLMPPAEGGGFWAIVSHHDIVSVSRNPDVFASSRGVMLEDIPADIADAAQSFLAMDAPRHTRLRRLVSSAFTPRHIARIEEQIHRQASAIVDELLDVGDCDFVAQVSQRLPAWTISDLMGVDEADRALYVRNANEMVGWNDPSQQAGRDPLTLLFDALLVLHAMASSMAQDRRSSPRDDLMTSLVQAEVDGQGLSDPEIAAFFVLLAVAGNDTTRHTISHGMKALCDHPDQRTLLAEDFASHIGTAAEEMIRWASPVMTFRRTAIADTRLNGQIIEAGDSVVLFYASGNRDEAAFDEPHRFDVTRSPNDHVGFGGGGPHFCLGASLARTQLRAIFDQLLHRAPRLEVGHPERLVGNFINGVMSMPCTVTSR